MLRRSLGLIGHKKEVPLRQVTDGVFIFAPASPFCRKSSRVQWAPEYFPICRVLRF